MRAHAIQAVMLTFAVSAVAPAQEQQNEAPALSEVTVTAQRRSQNTQDVPNVMLTRTFSKVYALAGLRSGYGVGHPDIMKKIARFGCGPTSTNMAGFGAVAASLDDRAHIERSVQFNDRAGAGRARRSGARAP
jgi:histidinol-phosphate/aromatic aminotransferase/cobyric acid decarboxylase-like protein